MADCTLALARLNCVQQNLCVFQETEAGSTDGGAGYRDTLIITESAPALSFQLGSPSMGWGWGVSQTEDPPGDSQA